MAADEGFMHNFDKLIYRKLFREDLPLMQLPCFLKVNYFISKHMEVPAVIQSLSKLQP